MTTTVNFLTDVYVGEYGEPLGLTLVDNVGNAVDISTYTGTKKVIARTPDALKTVTWTASFTTDGTDGKIKFTPASGDIDRPGDWEAQVELAKTSVIRKSFPFTMVVGKAVA